MKIAAVGSAFPPNTYDQKALVDAFKRHWGAEHHNISRLDRLHRNVRVAQRHLALPLEAYEELQGFGDANDTWLQVALDVGERAVTDALDRAGLAPEAVDALFTVTVTGIATPSLDARLMNRLAFPTRLKRTPIFGLGCLAGAAGVARAADYVRAYPDQVAVLLSVELCSLTLQRQDLSVANLIASGLFGDGAAAVVVAGDEVSVAGPRVVASQPSFYRETERVMGWDVSERGFQVVLSAEVPEMVTRHLADDVDAFLGGHGLGRSDIAAWIAHPGGPRVLEAMQRSLDLPPSALERTWRSLAEVGNLSSTSVLLVLAETLAAPPPAGSYGLLFAMGPGFCSELVLLQW